jgi:hypothetical protein
VELPAQDAALPIREPPRRDEPAVVLVVYAEGTSMGRDALFAPKADPEGAVERCRISRGHAVFKAFVLDTQLRIRETIERVDLGEGETRCIADALATVPLRGGMQTDQVVYVRFP